MMVDTEQHTFNEKLQEWLDACPIAHSQCNTRYRELMCTEQLTDRHLKHPSVVSRMQLENK